MTLFASGSALFPGAPAQPEGDDLHSVAEQADPTHLSAVTAAQDIVIAGVAAFEERMAVRRLDPAVVALRQHISGAVEKEMMRLRAKYSSEVAAEMELALHRVTQSLLHTPTLRAKAMAIRRSDSSANDPSMMTAPSRTPTCQRRLSV